MGFFDRFAARKPVPGPASPAAGQPVPAPVAPAGNVQARLVAARERLEARDLPGALAVYEDVLAGPAGDRADVLVTISGDLGASGHLAPIVELIAPRYDADRHGPATGLNLIQAYLALGNADAAQHVLDILFALNRPELEDRLHGFSNAIAELLAAPDGAAAAGPAGAEGAPRIGLITVSKPVWFYGLEPMAAQLLPPKGGRLRRIAFTQLAQPGVTPSAEALRGPEDEVARLSRALPLWFAETFSFAALYEAVAAVAFQAGAEGPAGNHPVVFSTEWTPENLRQLVETHGEGIDYIVTGSLRVSAGDHEVVLRVWEVKGLRERKVFPARWTPATADAVLSRLHADLRAYLEWSPASAAYAYVVPAQPRAWLDTLGASLGLFLAEKAVLPPTCLAPAAADVAAAAARAPASEGASLAYLTLRARARQLGLADAPLAPVARSPLAHQARDLLG
ncbi:MAG: hypothetical protein ACO3G4_06175 [Opitutaceae bacterium]